jgi:hypothetical protein
VIEDFHAVPESGTGAATPSAGDDADEAAWFSDVELRALHCVDGLVEALTEWGVLS